MDDRLKERFVTVGEFTSGPEAYLARDRLLEEGIRCFLEGETGHDLFGPRGFGAIRLCVLEGDAARAVGVLVSCCEEEVEEIDPPTDEEAEEGMWVCSVCGDASPVGLGACTSCGTERTALQSEAPRSRRWHWRRAEDVEKIQRTEENTTSTAPAPRIGPEPLLRVEQDDLNSLAHGASPADHLSGSALFAALYGLAAAGLVVVNLYVGVIVSGLAALYSLGLVTEAYRRRGQLTTKGAVTMGLAVLFDLLVLTLTVALLMRPLP